MGYLESTRKCLNIDNEFTLENAAVNIISVLFYCITSKLSVGSLDVIQ